MPIYICSCLTIHHRSDIAPQVGQAPRSATYRFERLHFVLSHFEVGSRAGSSHCSSQCRITPGQRLTQCERELPSKGSSRFGLDRGLRRDRFLHSRTLMGYWVVGWSTVPLVFPSTPKRTLLSRTSYRLRQGYGGGIPDIVESGCRGPGGFHRYSDTRPIWSCTRPPQLSTSGVRGSRHLTPPPSGRNPLQRLGGWRVPSATLPLCPLVDTAYHVC